MTAATLWVARCVWHGSKRVGWVTPTALVSLSVNPTATSAPDLIAQESSSNRVFKLQLEAGDQ